MLIMLKMLQERKPLTAERESLMSGLILNGLNEKQREAVQTTEGYVRIIAGAGSGKTKALTHRYAYLVRAAGIHPGNILCVTFTNKAAGEMKRRVQTLVGAGCDTALITTYHGFCVRVLREDIGRLFYPENFQILDTADQKKILEEIYTELELKLDHASFEKMMGLIGKQKATTDYVSLLLSRDSIVPEPKTNLDDLIIHKYFMRQKKIFGLDFDDLINFVFVLFERYPQVLHKWQERLHYIQVDEFQDSSERELRLVDLLSAVHRNLFVVGDPDQNIYEWRGAKVGILVDFDKTHAGTETIIMDRNYRSTANILHAANALIDHNRNRIKKELYTKDGAGEAVVHLHGKNEEEEARMILEQIRALRQQGYRYGEIAILYRSGFLSQFVEKALMSEEIPYEIVGSTKFFDRMEIMDAIAYLRLVASDDDSALLRIINTPRRKFGKAKVNLLRSLAEREGLTLFGALVKYCDIREFRQTKVGELIALIQKLRESSSHTAVSELLQQLLVESGYEAYIREAGNMERLDNLSEFKKITLSYERSYGKLSETDILPAEFLPLEIYLQQLALMKKSGTEEEETADRVKLMTIHAAKGLEFPVCFVVGMTEGVFPSGRTLEERKQEGLEEERRLCFVALTRAMKRLFLTDSEGLGNTGYQKTPSRFLFEIGETNYVRIGTISKAAMLKVDTASAEFPAAAEVLAPGSCVEHAIFGSGEVLRADTMRHVYEIKFQSGAVKPISMDYDFAFWRGFAEADFSAEEESAEPVSKVQAEPVPLPETILAADEDRFSETSLVPEEAPDILPEFTIPESLPFSEESAALPALQTQNTAADQTAADQAAAVSTDKKKKRPAADGINLWKDETVPHAGWHCMDIIDLGEPVGICQMCGHQIIRYVHKMQHPAYPRIIGAGCICAGKMEGDPEGARLREAEFKKKMARCVHFIGHSRKQSRNGNQYFKYKDEIVTILPDKFKHGKYKAVFRGTYTKSYDTPEEALREVFLTFLS